VLAVAAVMKQNKRIQAMSMRLTRGIVVCCEPNAIKTAPPSPKTNAKAGAPESASPIMPNAALIKAALRCLERLASAKKSRVLKASCAKAGVASCDSLASPRQAIKASKPPSAIARA
jgi:hypothetical protein